ncbi:MAG TPA: DUF4147 domain-containing protein [Candidatus Paceibacterota bacterium]|nr:DUF4147 domain-containing protein [Candidatus Paceibacterota bacterium]
MKIQNFEALATTPGRKALLSIAEAGLRAIDTGVVMRGLVQLQGTKLTLANSEIDLGVVGRIVVIAVGKCASEAGYVLQDILGDRITGGVVVDVKTCPVMRHMKTFCGTHPLASTVNLEAAKAIRAALEGLSEQDLAIFVVSGGGSTLLFLPQDETDRSELKVFSALTEAGATIQEINTVRKHMSLVRGGFLAQYAYPARAVSLIMSDVPANDIAFIASGPTVKDPTTIGDAERILTKYDVLRVCETERCGLIETPKDEKYFVRMTNVLAVSNIRALEAMKQAAEGLGFAAEIRDTRLVGEANDVGTRVLQEIGAAPARTVLLWGGETTVTVIGGGKGGRNLQASLSALRGVPDGVEILPLASDGRDHGAFAGAICDTMTKKAAEAAGAGIDEALHANDTYPFFEKIGNYVMTGDTGSNVSDLVIALKE